MILPALEGAKDTAGRFTSSFEDFKKLMLACMWGKRLTKNEILMLNLIQNVQLLSEAVRTEEMPLKTAVMVLEGLQKVYTRKMAYLYDDSKYILNQLKAPFKQAEYIKDSSEEVATKVKAKRKKEETGVKGYQPQTLKLDLKNSKWWNAGFNTEVLQQHISRLLAERQETSVDLHQEESAMIQVRAAAEGVHDQTTILQDLMLQSDQKDLRLKEPSAIEVREMAAELERPLSISPF